MCRVVVVFVLLRLFWWCVSFYGNMLMLSCVSSVGRLFSVVVGVLVRV